VIFQTGGLSQGGFSDLQNVGTVVEKKCFKDKLYRVTVPLTAENPNNSI
jgi:hypothetical protein